MASDVIAPWVADIHLLTVLAETRSFTQTARRLGLDLPRSRRSRGPA